MRLKRSSLDNLVLIVGASFFLWLLLLPKYQGWPVHYSDSLTYASSTLKGEVRFSDFAATVVGFRALYNKTDPYAVLGPALKEIGINWGVVHGNTHPPTSYLFAAPVAFFRWPIASSLWAWLMLCLLVFSYRFYGLSWKMSLGLMPLTLLWPPASVSLGQLTIVWMFGLAMAYYFRGQQLFWSGVGVGLASMTKYLPGLMMIIFLVKRKWMALLGFVSIWIMSLLLVTLLNPVAIPRYFEEQVVTKRVYDLNNPGGTPQTTSSFVMQRTDNSAPLLVSYRYAGWMGVGLMILLFSLIIFFNRHYFYDWQSLPSTRIWMLLSYFSVVCLPIFWLYSLLPLLPALIFLIFKRNIVTTVLCLYCILISMIYIQGGEQSVIPLASISVALGLAFVLDRLPFKLFQKQWSLSFFPAGDERQALNSR